MSLGRYPELGLADAHAKATECRRLLAHGKDPRTARDENIEAAKRAAVTENLTVRRLFAKWREGYLATQRGDGGAAIQALFDRYILTHIGEMPAADVRRRDIAILLDAARARGVGRTIALLLSTIRQMYGFAIERELVEIDPTARMNATKFGARSVERDRVLSGQELIQLGRQLRLSTPTEKLPGTARLKDETKIAIWLLLGTGLRISELLSLRWGDVDLNECTADVRMQDSATKGHAQTVFLSRFAKERFEELAAMTRKPGQNPGWCWPAIRKPDNPVCIKTINKQLNDRQRQTRLRGRSKAGDSLVLAGGKWTPHDLRRTAATLLGDADVDQRVIDRILSHREADGMRRIYQRQKMHDQKKDAWAVLGKILQEIKDSADRESDIT
jgi:integrase